MMIWLRIGLLAVTAALATACPAGGLTDCLSSADCPDGQICIVAEGRCEAAQDGDTGCFSRLDCKVNQECVDGRCVDLMDGDADSDGTDGDPEEGAGETDATPDGDPVEPDNDPEPDAEACSPGEKMCGPGGVLVCDGFGAGWALRPCADGEVCVIDKCVTPVCEPYFFGACASETDILVCNEYGSAWEPVPCGENMVCDRDRCSRISCVPGEFVRCSDDLTAVVCAATGAGWEDQACAPDGVCIAGLGCRQIICEPFEGDCQGDVLYECNGSRTGWDRVADCATDYFGVCVEGECRQIVCEADLVACSEDRTEIITCNHIGTAWTTTETCAGGTSCRGGVCLDPCAAAAYDRSYIGCEYWGVDLDNPSRAQTSEATYALVVANSNAGPVTVTITGSGGTGLASGVIPAGELRSFEFSSTRQIQGPGIVPSAYRLVSTLPVVVTQMNPFGNVLIHSNDATLLLPVGALDTDYLLMAWPTWRREYCSLGFFACEDEESRNSGFASIVAVEPGSTTVTVGYRGPSLAGGGVAAEQAGSSRSYTLSQYQVLTIQSADANCSNPSCGWPLCEGDSFCYGPDLTGSHIRADRRVAVFGGHECTFIPYDQWACDHLEHQIFPTQSWGKKYVAVRTEPRAQEVDYYRIMASEDNTLVEWTGGIVGSIRLNAGQFHEMSSDRDFSATADKPILMAQYVVSQDANAGGTGDPAMMLLAPSEQFRASYIFLVPPNYDYNHITIVAPSDTTVDIDGQRLDSNAFVSVTPELRRHRMSLAAGTHRLNASKPVGLYVYGYSWYVSYAYTAGLDLREINPKP